MRPFRACRGELPQGLEGVGFIGGHQIEAPLLQPHDGAAHQVHGGIDDHARNACRKRDPAPADRSGWNCAPSQLSLRTTAGISPPYSALATVASPASAA